MAERLNNNKFILFLRKTDPFILILHVIWSFFTLMIPLFIEYKCYLFEIPDPVVMILCIAIGAGAVIVKIFGLKYSQEKKWKLIHLSYFCFAPIIISILELALMNFIYDFSGVFLGGFGVLFMSLFSIVLASAAIVVIFGIECIKRRMQKKGKSFNREKLIFIRDIFNIICVLAILMAAIAFIITQTFEEIDHLLYKKEMSEREAFINEIGAKLPEEDGDMVLVNEARLYCVTVAMMAEDPEIEKEVMSDPDLGGPEYTNISKEVLKKGEENYLSFSADHLKTTDFHDRNEIFYDRKDRLIYVGMEYGATDKMEYGNEDCFMVVVYNEDLNVVNIYCETYDGYYRKKRSVR